eukprot:gnl/MRDRNA2_/MRDRNA2_118438_c0_seq1.p1 gnl/MRDRNA2_/MRDRNA2_118438_c0~~gnl/MRDRNA2_/MRDRNA2_118438_c0_seq1.p1  ORF type:complete len:1905 (-),score=330.47 gnl/MRDRNA2_/MRDRNA2_118438_c0_seq1:117-5831(-)
MGAAASPGCKVVDGQSKGMVPVMVSETMAPIPAPQPPAKMSRPEVVLLNSHTVSISWMPPVDIAALHGKLRGKSLKNIHYKDPNRLSLQGYRIRYGFVEKAYEAFDMDQTWDANTTRAVIKHLQGGRRYWFQVCSFNDMGNGDWSDPSEEFHMPSADDHDGQESTGEQLTRELQLGGDETVPVPVQRPPKKRPQHSSKSATSINISWEKPCDRGARVTAYDVLYSKEESFNEHGTLRVDGSFSKAQLTNLEPNTTYFFRHRAVNEIGCSNWSQTSAGVSTMAQPPDPPAPPRLDDAKAFTLWITWEAPKSYKIPVQKYRVRYATNSSMDDPVEVPVVDTKRRLKVTGLRPLTNYYFQVMAKNQVGSSKWSVYSKPMRTEASAPAQCEAPSFYSATIDTVTLQWQAPDCYGTPVDRYDVRMSRHHWMIDPTEYMNVTATVRSDGKVLATLPNCLPPGIQHYFQVRASGTTVGFGEWSLTSDAMFTKPERPDPPSAPKKFRPLPRAIHVFWSAAHDNGDPLIEHKLRYDTSADFSNPLTFPVKGSELSHVVTGLLPHTSYFFQIAAKNSIGWSDWSAASCPVQVVQEPPAKSGAPYILEGTCSTLTVGFTAPADVGTLDGTTIQAFTVRYSESYEALERLGRDPDQTKETGAGIKLIHPAKSPLFVSKLQPGRAFYFQVCATNQFGPGDWSDISEPMNTDASVPDPPTPPIQVEGTENSVVLQWTPPHDNGCKIKKYVIRILDEKRKLITGSSGSVNADKSIEHVEDDICTVTGRSLQHYNVSGLLPGTYYCFQVAAVNACGRGDWCEPTSLLRTEPTVPDPPGLPTPQEIDTHHFVATWPAGRDNGSSITEYTVEYTDHANWDRNIMKLVTTEQHIKIEKCTPGFHYFIKVSATNGIGVGPFSQVAKIRTAAFRPDEPLPPSASDIGPVSVHLTWTPPYDGGCRIKGYKISYKLKEEPYDGGEIAVEGLRRGMDLGGLSPGRRYTFQIRAVNSVGLSEWSQPTRIIQTSPPEAPSKTGAPFLLKPYPHSMQVGWMPAVDNGAEIIEQIICWSTTKDFSANVGTVSVSGLQSRRCSQLESEIEDTTDEAASGVSGLIHRMKKMKEQRKTIDDLKPGTAYYFTVKSINCIGPSPVSDVSDGLMTLPWKPERTPLFEAIGASSMWLKFRWSFPHDNGAPVHMYLFRYAKNEDSMPRDGQEGTDHGKKGYTELEVHVKDLVVKKELGNEYVLHGLEPGEGYWAAVQAVNEIGNSPWTLLKHQSWTDPMEPTKMDPVSPVSQTESSISFTWLPPSARGNPVNSFEIRWVSRTFLSPEPWEEVLQGNYAKVLVDFQKKDEDGQTIMPSLYEVPGLLPGTSVRVMMRAFNLIGPGEWGDLHEAGGFVTKSCKPESPNKPVLVKESLKSSCCQLRFQCGRPNGESITFFHYRVASNDTMTEGLREWKEEIPQPAMFYEDSTLKFAVNQLAPGCSYWMQVCQENVHGQSEWSLISDRVETLPDVPQKPTPPYSDQTTPKSVELRWFSPHDNGAPITGYMLRYKFHELETKSAIAPVFEILDPNAIEIPQDQIDVASGVHDVTGLSPGNTYFFQVRCRNKVGWSEWSNTSRGFVTRPSKPDAPENLQCVDHTPVSLDMTWEVPEEHGAPVTRYELVVSQRRQLLNWMYFASKLLSKCIDASRLCGVMDDDEEIGTQTHTSQELGQINFDGACQFIISPSTLTFSIEGLAPGKTYHTIIRAKNKAGSGNWTSPVGPMRTRSAVPAHTDPLMPVMVHHHMCTFAFGLPYDNGEPIERCIIKARWLCGPTSHKEVYHDESTDTKKLHPHLLEREETFNPDECEVMEFEELEVDEDDEKAPVVRLRTYPLEGLLAGTDYQVKWCCVNKLGGGMYSKSIVITTEANVPDVPANVVLEDDC